MFKHNLVCPKCGHQFLAKLGHHDAEVIHVTTPGTAFACPKCGATFSLAEALSKIGMTNTSKKCLFSYLCGNFECCSSVVDVSII